MTSPLASVRVLGTASGGRSAVGSIGWLAQAASRPVAIRSVARRMATSSGETPVVCAMRRAAASAAGYGRGVELQEAAGLALPQLRVEAAARQQLLVRALLDDAPGVHHHQPVHRGDS